MDGLIFYDIENAATASNLDFGAVAPGSSDDTVLRVFNSNSLYQAEDVTISVADDDAIQLWLSTDGDTFGASIAVGDIPPNGSSSNFWLRRVTASTVPDGPCSAHLVAAMTGWSHPLDTSTSPNVPLETGD